MGQNLPTLNLPTNTGSSFSSLGFIPPLIYQGDKEALHTNKLLTIWSLRVAYTLQRAYCLE